MAEDLILELKGITKIFPGVKALDNVQFQLRRGEVHALMGENGAGKSTFIKAITGVHQPEEGHIYFDGKEVVFKGTRDAQDLGIAAVYQHPTSYPELTVTENIFIGHEVIRSGMIQWNEMNKEAQKLLDRLHANFKVTDEVGALTIGQQQMVEIAKALSMNAKVILLDEPTAALTANESQELYRIVDELHADGVSIIFISHRMEDMYRLAERVTVFRDSQYIGTYDVDSITEPELIKYMVGREITDMYPKPDVKIGEPLFEIQGLSRTGYFKDVSLTVHAGEIVGLTGLVGAGRTETMEAVCGITKADAGKVILEGRELKIRKPKDAMKEGVILLPEDRQKQGLIMNWGLGVNVVLPIQDELANGFFINDKKEREIGKQYLEDVDTKAVSIFDPATSLSGGNQQKVVVAKALVQKNMKLVIMDEPTKGVDVGAKAEIYSIMGDLVQQGYGIILVSSDMAEVIGMSDRIYVMCKGRITGCLDKEEVTQEKILELAMEQSDKEVQ